MAGHDKVVRREAEKLKRAGWKVKADLPRYDKPTPIGRQRRIPDIEAISLAAVA